MPIGGNRCNYNHRDSQLNFMACGCIRPSKGSMTNMQLSNNQSLPLSTLCLSTNVLKEMRKTFSPTSSNTALALICHIFPMADSIIAFPIVLSTQNFPMRQNSHFCLTSSIYSSVISTVVFSISDNCNLTYISSILSIL